MGNEELITHNREGACHLSPHSEFSVPRSPFSVDAEKPRCAFTLIPFSPSHRYASIDLKQFSDLVCCNKNDSGVFATKTQQEYRAEDDEDMERECGVD